MSEVTITPEDPYYIRLTQDLIEDHKLVIRTGFNPALASGASQTIWSGGGLYVFPTTPVVMGVSSTNAADTAAGTGARTVLVEGLDENYNEISDVVTLNGVPSVPTPRPYLRVNTITVQTAGSNGANVGNIWCGFGLFTTGVPANKLAHIPVAYNISQSTHYTVPAGWSAYNVDIAGSAVQSATNQRTLMSTRARRFGELFLRGGSVATAGNVFSLDQTAFRGFPSKTDLDAIAETTDTNVWVTAVQRYILIKNRE